MTAASRDGSSTLREGDVLHGSSEPASSESEDKAEHAKTGAPPSPRRAETLRLVDVKKLKTKEYDGSCLRPLGLCELGSCDVCWYRPDHPRFQRGGDNGGGSLK